MFSVVDFLGSLVTRFTETTMQAGSFQIIRRSSLKPKESNSMPPWTWTISGNDLQRSFATTTAKIPLQLLPEHREPHKVIPEIILTQIDPHRSVNWYNRTQIGRWNRRAVTKCTETTMQIGNSKLPWSTAATFSVVDFFSSLVTRFTETTMRAGSFQIITHFTGTTEHRSVGGISVKSPSTLKQ